MKIKQPKKLDIQKVLKKLTKKYSAGIEGYWPIAENHIDEIRGLEFEEELFLKKQMAEHLGVIHRNGLTTR
ncbi:MAG TPA: hypothetical protein VKG26_04775 [Bacteroidia bacterium]|nr:hypothetical protein [Bacteroidia bacterium]